MPTNDFKPFATAGGANVSTQAEYLALAALSTGWQSGKASSKEVNKAVRQATFIAAALAQFVSDKGAVDVLDDGNLAGFGTNLIAALNQTSQPLDATLTALAALVGAANKLPYFNGADTAALTDLTQVGRDIIGKADIASVLTYLGFLSGKTATGGWVSLQGGFLFQWGRIENASAGAGVDVYFPTPFTKPPAYTFGVTSSACDVYVCEGSHETRLNKVRCISYENKMSDKAGYFMAAGF